MSSSNMKTASYFSNPREKLAGRSRPAPLNTINLEGSGAILGKRFLGAKRAASSDDISLSEGTTPDIETPITGKNLDDAMETSPTAEAATPTSRGEARRQAHKAIERKYRKVFSERLDILRRLNPFCDNPHLILERNYYHAPRISQTLASAEISMDPESPLAALLNSSGNDILAQAEAAAASASTPGGRGRPMNKLSIIKHTHQYISYLYSVMDHLNKTIVNMNGVLELNAAEHGQWLHHKMNQLKLDFDSTINRQNEIIAQLQASIRMNESTSLSNM